MSALAARPLAVNVDASAWAFYSSGIFPESDCGTDINHVVQLVGYGTNQAGNDFFKIRNRYVNNFCPSATKLFGSLLILNMFSL